MKKIILIILVVLIITGGIIVVLFYQANQPTIIDQSVQTSEENQLSDQLDNSITDNTEQTNDQNDIKTDIISKPVDEKQILKQQARVFAQRYGTYSSDGQFLNLYELRSLMTASFWQTKEAYIQSFDGSQKNNNFYSLSSVALSVKLINFTEQQAQYLVNCQQQSIKENRQQILYRALQISFIKQNNQWLVNGADWIQ